MKKLFCLILPVVIISGCCFNSTPPKTEYFTVNTPSAHANYNYHVKAAPFKVDELYGSKMVFFKEPNSIFFDSFNRWAQTPDKMLTSYFNSYFNNPDLPAVKEDYIPIRLNAVILKFECNLTAKECLLCMKVSAVNTSDNKVLFNEIFIEKQQMNKLAASSFASFMSKAVKTVAEKIEIKVNNAYKHIRLKKGKQ